MTRRTLLSAVLIFGGFLVPLERVGLGLVAQTKEFIYLNGKMVALEALLAPPAPDLYTVTPGSGGASAQNFVFSYSHPSSGSQFTIVNGLIRELGIIGSGACYFASLVSKLA